MNHVGQVTVSVVIPLFNRRELIAAAIESVLGQTVHPLEIIVVDDGSTDGSGDVVRQMAGQHSLIRYVRQQNAGSGTARNAGIRLAQGDWIAFLDSDDRWLPTKLEAALNLIGRDAALDIVHSNRRHVTADGVIAAASRTASGDRLTDKHYLLQNFAMKTSTVLMRHSRIDAMEPDLFTGMRKAQDYEFFWRATAMARRIGYLDTVDTEVLLTGDGMSRSTDRVSSILSDIAAIQSAAAWLAKRDDGAAYVASLEQLHYRLWRRLFVDVLRGGQVVGLPRRFAACARATSPVKALRAVVSAWSDVFSSQYRGTTRRESIHDR